eukprot:TRINITY_DN1373_c0_g1_i2.p1 TRINITY_DN1373_c0_g1~~TRINITY_DN1373_c0_g1_i2.p1  ORF type:complete len:1804 (-),score=237.19 TRINITY_DN1373_c0_g1_i2:8682-14093(-)
MALQWATMKSQEKKRRDLAPTEKQVLSLQPIQHKHHHRHKRRHHDSPEELEESDLDLVQENVERYGIQTGMPLPLHRKQAQPEEGKQLKRLKKSEQEPAAPKVKDVAQLDKELFGEDVESEGAKESEHIGARDYRREESKLRRDKAKIEVEEGEVTPEDSEEDMGEFIVESRPPAERGGEAEEYPRHYRKPRAAPGMSHITATQLQVAQEIFGDFGDLPEVRPTAEEEALVREQRKIRLEELYEPKEITSKYVTEFDKKIKETDIPERMQLYLEDRLTVTQEELQAETEWIWKQRKEKDQKDLLKNVLETYKVEHFETPFIYTYRKHVYKQALDKKTLWDIYKLDREWDYLCDQKGRLLKRLQPIVDQYKQFTPILEELQAVQSLSEIEDIRGFIDFYQALMAAGKGQGVTTQAKISTKQIQLSKWVQARVPEFADKIFLRSWEFSENLKHMQLIHSPPDVKAKVRILAKNYIAEYGKDLLDEERVLMAVMKYAAEELSVLPVLRKMIREYYLANAVVSTEPTQKGEAELDVFNPSYRVKRILKRPITTFQNDLWLDIKHHESRGFITVKVFLEEEKMEVLRNQLLQCYVQNADVGRDEAFVECNAIRKEALNSALKNYLVPYAEAQAKDELATQAQEFVLDKCAEQFKAQVMAGPYRATNENTSGGETEEALPGIEPGVKVLSFVVDVEIERRAVVQMAMVDQHGELLDHKILHNVMFKNVENLGPAEKLLYEQDMEECKQFTRKYEPDLIVIGANRLEAQALKRTLRKMEESEAETFEPEGDKPKKKEAWVTWGDLTIPKIYSTTEVAAKQMPEATPLLRMTVSQARLKQDPMSEILNLWAPSEGVNSIFSIMLHPLQRLVNPKKLEETLEQVAVECVNEVGVDINKIVDHPHLTQKLSFICGLGPRKAQDIILALQKKGKVNMRIDLKARVPLGDVVYKNCIGFIKVYNEVGDESFFRDLLDLTRIHPESYFIATKIAGDAIMDEYASSKEFIDPRDDNFALEKIMKNPSKLDGLDIVQYKEQLDKANQGNAKLIVDFVVQELKSPFKDPRPKYKDLVNEDLFYLLMGETRQTFYVGMIVSATVIMVHDNNVRCKLENGMDAFIKKADLIDDSSEWNMDITKKVTDNTVIPARVKEISMRDAKFVVNLTIRKEDLRSHANWIKLSPEDRKYFYVTPSDVENKRMIEEEKKRAAKYVPRRIMHKKFKNLSLLKATDYLSNKDVGEFVFRPSSKGEDHMTLTFKFYKNTYSHVDIREEDKPLGAPIGRKLFIGNEVYESLDEIIARYITPVVEYAKETASHRKFLSEAISMKMVEDHLMQEQQATPNIIGYCFAILPEYPQYVILAYTPKKDKIVKEFVKVKPQGYSFHDNYHKNLNTLITWFKQHFTDADYQRYVRKYNKPPTRLVQKTEAQQPKEKAEAWKEISKEWQNDDDKVRDLPPDTTTGLQGDQSNTPYLPKTEYNRGITPAMASETPGIHSEYPARFSTYESKPEPMYSRREEYSRDEPHRREDQKRGSRGMVCYNCNQEGHMARSCPNQRAPRGGRGGFRGESRGRGSMRGRGESRPSEPLGWDQNQIDNAWGEIAAETSKEGPRGAPSGDSWGDQPANVAKEAEAPWGVPAPAPEAEYRPPGEEESKEKTYARFNTVDKRQSSWDQPPRESAWDNPAPQPMSDIPSHRGDRGRGRGGPPRGRGCFNCGQEGHMAKDCPQPRTGGRGGAPRDRNCYRCGKPGHMSKDCPEAGDHRGRSRGGRRGERDNRRSRSRSNERPRENDTWGGKPSGGWDNETNENKASDSGWQTIQAC